MAEALQADKEERAAVRKEREAIESQLANTSARAAAERESLTDVQQKLDVSRRCVSEVERALEVCKSEVEKLGSKKCELVSECLRLRQQLQLLLRSEQQLQEKLLQVRREREKQRRCIRGDREEAEVCVCV